jgi:diaminopimelate epimerase
VSLEFTKMHGIGNDFIMVNAIKQPIEEKELPQLARKMNDRKFGVGGDGLILILQGEKAPFRMRMFNPDGSESEMCGNGIRCFAAYLQERGLAQEQTIDVETGAGNLQLQIIQNGVGTKYVRVNMGIAKLTRAEIPMKGQPQEKAIGFDVNIDQQTFKATAVSMGNPHCVIFVQEANAIPLEQWGPVIENHPDFPNRTNVHFAQIVAPNEIIQRTWERGAGATLACGTGACAVLVAAVENGLTERKATVHLPGGDLEIEYLTDGTVFKTGPAQTVFDGIWGT